MSLNQCNKNAVNVLVIFISNLLCFASVNRYLLFPFFSILSPHRDAYQSRWSVHISSIAPTSPSTTCLHLCPSSTLCSSKPAEEDHAITMPGESEQPGRGHKLQCRTGTGSQQLGAEQQHSPGDQVSEDNKLKF